MYLKEMTRLSAALNALYMEQDDIYSAYAAHFGLSGTAFWILYAICESDEVKTQNALADGFHMPRQSINSAAAALAKQASASSPNRRARFSMANQSIRKPSSIRLPLT